MIRRIPMRCVQMVKSINHPFETQIRYNSTIRDSAEMRLQKALRDAVHERNWDSFTELWEQHVTSGVIQPQFKPILDRFKNTNKYVTSDINGLRQFMDKMSAAEKYNVTSAEIMSLARYCETVDQLYEMFTQAVSLVRETSSAIGLSYTQQAMVQQIAADALLAVRTHRELASTVDTNLRILHYLQSVGVSPEPLHWTISMKNETLMGTGTTDGLNKLWSEMADRFRTTPTNVVYTTYISGCCRVATNLLANPRAHEIHSEAEQKFREAKTKCRDDLTVAAMLLLKLKLRFWARKKDAAYKDPDAREANKFIKNHCTGYNEIDTRDLSDIYRTRNSFLQKAEQLRKKQQHGLNFGSHS